MVAAGLKRGLSRGLGLDARMLRQRHSLHDAAAGETHLVCLVDNRSPRWQPAAGMRWVDEGALGALLLARPEHGPTLRAWFDKARTGRPPATRAPWAQPTWHAVADAWILARLADVGVEATGPIEQIKCGSMSCVLRAPTTDGMVYFKASPEVFAHEAPLTAALGRLCPDTTPRDRDRSRAKLDADGRYRRHALASSTGRHAMGGRTAPVRGDADRAHRQPGRVGRRWVSAPDVGRADQ